MASYERSVSGCSTSSSDSIKSRSSSIHSVANYKMGFEEFSSKGNGGKYLIQRLPGMEHLRIQEEASTTDEQTHRKCLSVAYIANDLCDNIGFPETQKLKDIGSWNELFLEKYPVGDSIKDTGEFILDHDIETRRAQKRKEKDDIDQNFGILNLDLLHSDFPRPHVTYKHSQEHSEIWNPYTFSKSNKSSFANEILHPGQTLKYEKEREDIIIYSNIREEHEVDHHNRIKNNSQNSHITQKDDDPFVSTLGSQKNEAYFWAPLNDSSDEECKDWTDVKTNGLQISAAGSKKIKSSCDTADIFRPEERKLFSFQMLGGRPCYTEAFDSSEEKWNPEILQIKDYKSKDFKWVEKPEGSTETTNNVEGLSEEATKRSIFFNHRSKVKKDLSRNGMLDFQPLQEVTDQRNESEAGCIPEKYCEGNKHNREDETKSTFHRGNCKKGQRKTELKSQRKESFLQMNSLCGSISPSPSENSTCKMGSECLELSYKSTDLCTNSDCILLGTVPQFNDESMACIPSTGPRCLQGNISEGAIRSIVGSKSDAEELLSARVRDNVNQKLFRNDKSHSDYSVLAKYYFYLNYLNKSKRLQYQEDNYSFFCQQSSREASISALCTCKSNSLDEQQAEECMNIDFGTCEISCHKDKRTEALKQQGHPEQQEYKAVFASMNPKPLSNLALNTNRLGNPSILKDKEVFEVRKIATNTLCPQRHWARASIAWSAYTHGEVKPRSQHIQTPATGNKVIRKSNCKSQRCTSSGTESKVHPNSAVQGGGEINLRTQGDYDLLPWLLLPDELWFCIFSLLTHKDISRVSQVCHRFYRLAKDESLWKEIQLTNCHCLNDDWLITLGSHHPQRFTLDHCHDESQNITRVGLKRFFQHCEGSLKELNIRNCSGPGFRGDTILLHASTFCHNLRAVDISWTGATDSGLIALVKASRRLTDDSVAMLIEDHGKRLKKLEIFGCHAVTAKCLNCVAVRCPNLKVLNIGRVPRITEDCLAKIVNCMEKLTSLNCTGLNVVKDSLVHFIVKKCPDLECLILHSCSQVTDSSLVEISTHLPSIRYLDVSGCEKVTDAGVQALARKCHRISYLDLSSTATSKRGVYLLASFCFQTLECVKLSFCKDISLDAVGKLCRNCKRLRILHLYGCRFVPDLESIKKVNKNVEILYDLHVPAAKFSSE
nr:PREDICTED: uncharacterized protein LOC103277653 isoform X2 [Anolis carolinensis]|eukprot:XP_008101468.1 PREDICTED: uncharacterized protein LOC103277653 isoform X2 [Anolis carolinensis]